MSEIRDLADGESCDMQGSGSKPYVLKNTGGVYSCSCPAWRNQSIAIETRTCKHLRKLRGDSAEHMRVGTVAGAPAAPKAGKASSKASTAASTSAGAADPAVAGKAPPVLLAHSFTEMSPAVDPSGWWLSEKLDGVRAWWDGKQFVSRLGNPYFAPDWFVAGLPDFPLDGELWLGRKQFQRCVSIVRRQDRNAQWEEIRYLVFDAPGIDAPFERRQAECLAWFERTAPKYAAFHPHEACRDKAHLDEELARVEALGGEGLMLRQPASAYIAGRSTSLLKVKSFLDTEARVIGYTKGAGRHAGRVGALEVELANGTLFSVGTGLSDAQRDDPPPVGSIVGVRYQELSDGGVPRFPTYLGVRDDILWVPTR